MKQETISLDIETYSSTDLMKSGMYRYVESPDFTILLFGYKLNDEEIKIVDIAQGETIPTAIYDALMDKNVLKTAYNAPFERICLETYLGINMPPYTWDCTMVKAATIGLPMGLDKVAQVLKINNKMPGGNLLINYFSKPCKPTKTNNGRTRNLPHHSPEKWQQFKEYCKQDVLVENQIRDKLTFFEISKKEKEVWYLDQKINNTGIKIHKKLVTNAIAMSATHTSNLLQRLKTSTGLANPNSVAQLKKWIHDEIGIEVASLSKEAVITLITKNVNTKLTKVLKLRQKIAKTSIKKYQAMHNVIGTDDRARGLLQFYGATRTGRWCLAEKTPVSVMTPNGEILEKPIEEVQITDLVFDGKRWVEHEGVVYSGDKEVITWDGVTATPEHIVYVSDDKKVSLSEAKERRLPLWIGERAPVKNDFEEEKESQENESSYVKTYDIINAGVNNRFMASKRIVSNSGRLIQVQNLPRNEITDLSLARDTVLENDLESLKLLYGNVLDILSQLVRTAFIAEKEHIFIVVDFSSIEAVILSWLAKEQWRLDVFNTHGKIYEMSASKAFNIPIEQIDKKSPWRQKGKLLELACGYNGGVDALVRIGALRLGLDKEELPGMILAWRQANPRIVRLWRDINAAALETVRTSTTVSPRQGITFYMDRGILFIELPSGRKLAYLRANIQKGKFGNNEVVYTGTNQTTKQWTQISTYGGKLTENIVQAIARDCLRDAMLRLDKAGYTIVMHVHDEVVLEVPKNSTTFSLKHVKTLMDETLPWARDLKLRSTAFETEYYYKD